MNPAKSKAASADFSECFRLDAKGKIVDTQDRLMSHASESVSRARDDDDDRPRRRARVERDERYYSRASARGYQDGWQYERQYQYQYQSTSAAAGEAGAVAGADAGSLHAGSVPRYAALLAPVDVLHVREGDVRVLLSGVVEIEGVTRQEDDVAVEVLGDGGAM